MRQQFRCSVPVGLQGIYQLGVDGLAPALEQALVGGVADERVLEDVGAFRDVMTAEDQFRLEQPRQRVLQPRSAEGGDRLEQLEAELAPDAGGSLRHLLHRLQAVEPRHQRIVQRGGDGELLERRRQLETRRGLREAPGLQHGLGQLLDEQRHAVGPDGDLVNDRVGQGLAARQAYRRSP